MTRDEIEQFYAGLARAELNQEPGREKLKWWSEVTPGELRFQCSFKRPSMEAVDEVVQRLSGDNGESLGKRLSLENQSGDQPNQELSVVQSSQDPRTSLPAADIERSFSLDAADLETVVHRISIDMEECFGRRPSMEELAAGISIYSANAELDPRQMWCQERLEHFCSKQEKQDVPWSKSARTVDRTTIAATPLLDESERAPIGEMGRKSLGKPIDDSADLAWLRQSSMAAIEALREHQNRRGQHLTNVSQQWTPWTKASQGHNEMENKTTIKAQPMEMNDII